MTKLEEEEETRVFLKIFLKIFHLLGRESTLERTQQRERTHMGGAEGQTDILLSRDPNMGGSQESGIMTWAEDA